MLQLQTKSGKPYLPPFWCRSCAKTNKVFLTEFSQRNYLSALQQGSKLKLNSTPLSWKGFAQVWNPGSTPLHEELNNWNDVRTKSHQNIFELMHRKSITSLFLVGFFFNKTSLEKWKMQRSKTRNKGIHIIHHLKCVLPLLTFPSFISFSPHKQNPSL